MSDPQRLMDGIVEEFRVLSNLTTESRSRATPDIRVTLDLRAPDAGHDRLP